MDSHEGNQEDGDPDANIDVRMPVRNGQTGGSQLKAIGEKEIESVREMAESFGGWKNLREDSEPGDGVEIGDCETPGRLSAKGW